MDMPPAAPAPVEIVPVTDKRDLERFLRVPWGLYRDDPHWVPPLLMERREHFSPKNPYFEHARFAAWLALRAGEPVGRISAQIDRLHLERHGDATGFFGCLEGVDDGAVFRVLTGAAEDWLRTNGMRRVRGPFSLSINDESGLLVDGFDTPPMIMMGHARPYYAGHLENCGYRPAKDLLAYRIEGYERPPALERMARRLGERIQLRAATRKTFARDLALIGEIFNDAWSDNWGFLPLTPGELDYLGHNLKLFVPLDFVQVVEIDGEPAAMLAGFPNLNETICDLDGRLLPLGWAKLLWRLKIRGAATARVALMGVRKAYHRTPLGAALALFAIDAFCQVGKRRGVRMAELSWILEDNQGVRNIIETLGGTAYKTYRVFGKELDPAPGAPEAP